MRAKKRRMIDDRIAKTIQSFRQTKLDTESTKHSPSKQLKNLGREKMRNLDVAEFLKLSELFNNDGELDFMSKTLSKFLNVNHFLRYAAGKEKKADEFVELNLGTRFALLDKLIECLKECKLLHSGRMPGYDNRIYLEITSIDKYNRISQIEE